MDGRAPTALEYSGPDGLPAGYCDAGGGLPSRAPDYQLENRALTRLLTALADRPAELFDVLAEVALEVCRAQSVVVCVNAPDSGGLDRVRPVASVGAFQDWDEDNDPIVSEFFAETRRRGEPWPLVAVKPQATPAATEAPPICQALVAPLSVDGRPIGLVCALSHAPEVGFDEEHFRQLISLSRFASSAYRTISAQSELRASEARFRALVTCPGPVVFRASTEGFILDAPGWESLTGQAPPATLGTGWLEIVHPDDRDPLIASWSHSMVSSEPTYVDYRLRDKDGVWRWVSGYSAPVRGDDGAIVEWMGTVTDVHHQREAEARRQAIVTLADMLRDLTDIPRILELSGRTIAETLEAESAAFGVLDVASGTMRLEQAWPPSRADKVVPVPRCHDYRAELERGEPIAIADLEGPGAAEGAKATYIVYRPITGDAAQHWALLVRAHAPRAWTPEELSFARDVTERARGASDRQRVELDLRDRARRLEAEVEARTAETMRLWRNSRDLLVVVDRKGICRAASPACETVLGWPSEAIEGRHFANFIHRDDHRAIRTVVRRMRGSDSPPVETRCLHKNGEVRWVSWIAVHEQDLTYAIGRHISAEKEAAAALEETQSRLRSFFETSYQYRAIVSLDGALLEANATALEAGNVRREEIVGAPIWETPWFNGTPGLGEAVRREIQRVKLGEILRENIQLNLPAQGWRWLDFTLRPMAGANGEPIAIVLEAVDITERRRTERALRQSQKLEAMGQLTGGVAHDFNNLLTPIIGSLDLVRRRALGSERDQRLVAGALQSAERARSLVQRLLAFARRQPLQTDSIDIAVLVGGVVELIASTVGPHIAVAVEVAPDLPRAQADPNQLEMAILNLSVNARDAMPDGGRLTIAASADFVDRDDPTRMAPGPYVKLSVSDTGQGMDEATLARAVEPFFSTKPQGQGTGLGLSMVHGLASQLGGALRILSEPGQGAVVELWLPASQSQSHPSVAAHAKPASFLHAGKVLLVDDEALPRAAVAAMLADLGYDVTEASSPNEALAMIEADKAIDILVTDHLMPGMKGADLARLFRERRAGAPALIISGYADVIPSDVPHLSKPFRQDDLAASLEAIGRQA